MSPVRSERLTVPNDEGLVVFLIGARANRWWNLPVVFGVARAMSRMMKELQADPDAGLLAYESYGGRTTLMVQYWRSLEHLHAYAHAREKQHIAGWRAWLARWGRGAMGIWHETYIVSPGAFESVYHHMPPFGLGKVFPLVPAEGHRRTARSRLRAEADSTSPSPSADAQIQRAPRSATNGHSKQVVEEV